ncbi:DNA (cytosine-5)-methyltransferase 3-like [Microcebus murinus]|uniref:DNA (cytosine-5)-methyltransferase 3-like n=1 Tax=Microcebus murinus TaxID=30608 RepID=UPI003F6CA2F6
MWPCLPASTRALPKQGKARTGALENKAARKAAEPMDGDPGGVGPGSSCPCAAHRLGDLDRAATARWRWPCDTAPGGDGGWGLACLQRGPCLFEASLREAPPGMTALGQASGSSQGLILVALGTDLVTKSPSHSGVHRDHEVPCPTTLGGTFRKLLPGPGTPWLPGYPSLQPTSSGLPLGPPVLPPPLFFTISDSMALSSPGTLSLETLDGWHPNPDPDPDPDSEPAGHPPSETFLDPEAEPSVDVILVGSSPPSPGRGRDLIAYEVQVNQRNIEGQPPIYFLSPWIRLSWMPGDSVWILGSQRTVLALLLLNECLSPCCVWQHLDTPCTWVFSLDLCLCCGSFQVHTQHPLFEGGMCAPCKDKFLDTLFLYDDDGYQSYCSICCAGETLLICENPDCTRCYCFECVDSLVSPGTSEKVHAMSNWVCFLCLPFSRSGLLQRRRKWRAGLKAFCDRESDSPLEMYKTVAVWKREPVRVLSLFGDIKRELASLGFLESGSGPGRLRHLEDVTDVVRRDVEDWGPFDLVYGATPPLGHTCYRPPGWFLFQFCRLLQYARPPPGSPRPFFWMFVDNLVLSQEDVAAAARFLETEPVTVPDVRGGTLQDAVRVWSNVPAVRSKHSAPISEEELSLLAQDRQRARPHPRTPARLVKNCFLPLREYFKYFSAELTSSL